MSPVLFFLKLETLLLAFYHQQWKGEHGSGEVFLCDLTSTAEVLTNEGFLFSLMQLKIER
jgi:hypothetical protein